MGITASNAVGCDPMDEVQNHFDELLQRDPSQRAAYLESLRKTSSSLAAKVEALLADLQEAEAEAFLNTNETKSACAIQPGRIGNYRVLDTLGRGGMGTVYLARQCAGTRRLVALKLVHSSGDADRLLKRFEREKQLLAFLDHRHITKLYEVGTAKSGEPFFAMEYVKGLPIDTFCDRNRFTIERRMRLFVKTCEAIAHAHQKGVIHRDLKPGNVLVKWEEGVAVPKVIDFGVARIARIVGQGRDPSRATIVGTPAFMSPEQCLGKGDIDTRSDIYALGATLYKMLVGKTPHEPEQTGEPLAPRHPPMVPEVLLPPSKRLRPTDEKDEAVANLRGTTVAKLKQGLKGDLDRICLKAMAFEPSQRYPTVLDMARDIECFLSHRPISATPPRLGYRLKRFVRRNRGAVTAAALIFLAVFAGILATSAALWRARAANQEARRSAVLAKDEAAKSRAAFSALQTILASPDPFIERRDLPVSELLKKFPDVIAQALVDEKTQAMLEYTIGQTYINLGDPEAAGLHLEQALERYTCLLGPDHENTLETEILLTRAWSEQGHFAKAMSCSKEIFQRAIMSHQEDHPVVLSSMENLMANCLEGRKYEEARRLSGPAFFLAVDRFGLDHKNTALLVDYIGQAASYLRDFEVAGRYFELAYAICEEVLGKSHPQTLETMHSLVLLKVNSGQAKDYLATAEALVGHQEAIRGSRHPYSLGARMLLGHAQLGAGAFSEARDTFFTLLELGEEVFEPGHPRLAYCYQYLGKASYAVGNYDEAVFFMACGLSIEKDVFGTDSLRVAVSTYNLGLAKMEQESQLAKAGEVLQRALHIFREEGNEAGLYYTLNAQVMLCRRRGETSGMEAAWGAIAKLDLNEKPLPLTNMIVAGLPGDFP